MVKPFTASDVGVLPVEPLGQFGAPVVGEDLGIGVRVGQLVRSVPHGLRLRPAGALALDGRVQLAVQPLQRPLVEPVLRKPLECFLHGALHE